MTLHSAALVLTAAAAGAALAWLLKPAPTTPPIPVVERLLTAQEDISQMPFRELVPQVTDGKRVLPLDEHSQPLIDAILQAAESTVAFLNGPNSPARQQRRINEVSRFAEEHLRSALGAIPDIVCTIPTNAQGKQVRSGYPDLIVTHTNSGRIAYLDPKLYEAGSEDSTLRTFYFQPRRETSKILHDAHHLLLGFRHDGNAGDWHIDTFKLIDLHRFQIGLKVEFQGSNRDIYKEELLINGD